MPHSVVCEQCGEVLVAPERDPLVGQVVGGYRVLRRLGLGGMGAVYEGLEETIQKRAALKVLHPHLSQDPRLPSLLAEARAVNAIGDEGIVDIYGFGSLPDGRSYLVMELLDGELLEAQLARRGRLSVLEAIDLLVPLLQALEAAHAAGFVHRDLKAGNIFVVSRPPRAPFPKLLDFGIAHRITTRSAEALGTPGYVAPEQAKNRDVGAKADLYALGCLIFEMLTGRLPFVHDSVDEVLRQHREAPRPSLKATVPGAPEALDALVRSLMAVEPTQRPVSAAAVRTTLLSFRADLLARRARSSPLRWFAVAAVGVVALGLVAVMTTRQPPTTVEPTRANDPIAEAVKQSASDVERRLDGPVDDAVEALKAAETSFPGRPEWKALRGQLATSLRRRAQDALKLEDPAPALALVATLARLGALGPDDPLELEAKRASFASQNGMVRVGAVFIDRYEYPNRAGAMPVTRVDWSDAVALCEGVGKHLCSELEWEQACRGTSGFLYPWGPMFEKGRCVTRGAKKPSASGSRPRCAGPAGVFDLVGNVAEWTSSPLHDGAAQRVIRGGSFTQSDSRLPCGARDYLLPGQGGTRSLGLRCCR
ncbi:MAG: bifunctional serine/threonine-protein kinase/formylglycine-generating enzyme family protein [Myxococcales bacterium]|nr:bifunctional serine/threonine-protein kinase/formylglycine-generating enzyme family protein [Myxococcales bacterium]